MTNTNDGGVGDICHDSNYWHDMTHYYHKMSDNLEEAEKYREGSQSGKIDCKVDGTKRTGYVLDTSIYSSVLVEYLLPDESDN